MHVSVNVNSGYKKPNCALPEELISSSCNKAFTSSDAPLIFLIF